MFSIHAISCLKCMLFRVSNLDIESSLKRLKRTKRARCFWFVYTRCFRLYFMLFNVLNVCYFVILYWCRLIIKNIKENEKNAMYIISWHAISQFIFYVSQYLKYILVRILNVVVKSSLERSKRTKIARYIWFVDTRCLSLYLMFFNVSKTSYFVSQILSYDYY